MKRLFALLLALPALCFGASATFSPSTAILDNPERGPYYHLDNTANQACGYAAAVVGGAEPNSGDGLSSTNPATPLRLFLYYWNPGVMSTATVTTDLGCIRAAGAKVIFSIVYCESGGCDEGVNISQALADIASIKTILAANRDVLYVVRMGTIGAWGEWHDSVEGLDTRANKLSVMNAYMAAVPPEIPVMIRYPYTAQDFFPTVLNFAHSYEGSPLSRLGFYSDCYMGGDVDIGTYTQPGTIVDETINTSVAQQQAYAQNMTGFTAFGGETCTVSPPQGNPRMACTGGTDSAGLPGGIMNEGPRFHLTYLHRLYEIDFWTTWFTGGCYQTVLNLMGYRIQLDALVHADTMVNGTTNTFTLTLHNYGWGEPYSRRVPQVRLMKTGAPDIVCKFGLQLRRLPPNATASTGTQALCKIPSGATTGVYNVFIEMPDLPKPDGTLPAAVYSIRPANANSGSQTWDNTNRRWATGTVVTIS